MPRSIDLFIRADLSATDLAARIVERTPGVRIEADPADGAPVVVDGAVRAVLRRHPFSIDDDLVLSRYPYALTVDLDVAGHLADTPEVRSLRRISTGLVADHAVLLVLDLQYRKPGGWPPPAVARTAAPGPAPSRPADPEPGAPEAGAPEAAEAGAA